MTKLIHRAVFIIFLVLSLTAANGALAGVTAPEDLASGTETGLFVRLFKDVQSATLMAELGGINQTDDRQFREITVGAYHDLYRNSLGAFSVGAFYRRAYGLRHDNDWQSNNGTWKWVDTNSRGEDFIILDTTAKFIPPVLPFQNVSAEIKMRFLQDFFNGEETLMLRPGLTYFWFKNDQPFMNFFLQYEFDLPLNYGQIFVNERWLYLGTLYRVANELDIGAFAAQKWQAWGNASAYDNKGGTPYLITANSAVMAALLIWHL